MKKLLIIDGNAIVHRAFHALPPLTDKNGELVNAVYGFFSMLLKVIEDVKPTNIIVCFDRPKPTFRKTLYAGYQANRPQMADGLSGQFAVLYQALEKAHITMFGVEGYEADDVIGTLATQAARINTNITNIKYQMSNKEPEKEKFEIGNLKLEIIILSGDRDLLQLVNPQVKILMPITGITKMILHDEKSVEEKYGIKPSQFIDYKALIGDASDGYPGVSGIGPKTAASLLKKFGSFENLYGRLGEVPLKIGEKLATDAEQAALAKKLATIVTDVPVHLDLEACSMALVTKEDFYEAWNDLGFASLRKRLEAMTEIKNRREQLGLL